MKIELYRNKNVKMFEGTVDDLKQALSIIMSSGKVLYFSGNVPHTKTTSEISSEIQSETTSSEIQSDNDIAKSPFDNDEDDGSVGQDQVNSIVEYLNDNNVNGSIIESYDRRVNMDTAPTKALHLFNRKERLDGPLCCKILANEANVGGIRYIGSSYTDGDKIRVCIEDHSGVCRKASFYREHEGKLLTKLDVNTMIKSHLSNLKIMFIYNQDFTSATGCKSNKTLPRDTKEKS